MKSSSVFQRLKSVVIGTIDLIKYMVIFVARLVAEMVLDLLPILAVGYLLIIAFFLFSGLYAETIPPNRPEVWIVFRFAFFMIAAFSILAWFLLFSHIPATNRQIPKAPLWLMFLCGTFLFVTTSVIGFGGHGDGYLHLFAGMNADDFWWWAHIFIYAGVLGTFVTFVGYFILALFAMIKYKIDIRYMARANLVFAILGLASTYLVTGIAYDPYWHGVLNKDVSPVSPPHFIMAVFICTVGVCVGYTFAYLITHHLELTTELMAIPSQVARTWQSLLNHIPRLVSALLRLLVFIISIPFRLVGLVLRFITFVVNRLFRLPQLNQQEKTTVLTGILAEVVRNFSWIACIAGFSIGLQVLMLLFDPSFSWFQPEQNAALKLQPWFYGFMMCISTLVINQVATKATKRWWIGIPIAGLAWLDRFILDQFIWQRPLDRIRMLEDGYIAVFIATVLLALVYRHRKDFTAVTAFRGGQVFIAFIWLFAVPWFALRQMTLNLTFVDWIGGLGFTLVVYAAFSLMFSSEFNPARRYGETSRRILSLFTRRQEEQIG